MYQHCSPTVILHPNIDIDLSRVLLVGPKQPALTDLNGTFHVVPPFCLSEVAFSTLSE